MNVRRSVPVEQMTPRARAYIAVTAATNIIIGSSALVLAGQFSGPAFEITRSLFPIPVWGVAFVMIGVFLTRAAYVGHETAARVGMVLSVIGTVALGAGFVLSYVVANYGAGGDGKVSVIGSTLCAALIAKDCIVSAQPLRSPFEPVVRRYEAETCQD